MDIPEMKYELHQMNRNMRNRIYNYYVLSARFDGNGRGFAIGFDNETAAHLFATYVLVGFSSVVSDYYMEMRYPQYYHDKISRTL